MNSIPGREPRPDRSRYQSTQRNPQKGLLLGTDFRHAVEFSRSGRAATSTLSGSRHWRLFPLYAARGGEHLRGFSAAPEGLGGATETKVHDPRTPPQRGSWWTVLRAGTGHNAAGRAPLPGRVENRATSPQATPAG